VCIDGTLGMGGHSEGILTQTPARVIGIDRDPQALALASERLRPFGDRFTPVHATYSEVPEVLTELGITSAQGILLDLGVSSLQLDEPERGFSYSQDAPLDMRMDTSGGITAADILNTYDEKALTRILRDYGEERFAQRIARAIVRRRESTSWTRTADLAETVKNAIPAAARATGGNPCKRTFQALRIEVNGELDDLRVAIPSAIESLAVQGRMVVEAYQSLEDRMVKREFARGTTSSAPPDLPIEPQTHRPYLRALTHGAERADETEQRTNPRSTSVRLRAVERLRPTPDHMKQRSRQELRR
jgi:16S rRNA (cytosine1402-N4)-methyltransferase